MHAAATREGLGEKNDLGYELVVDKDLIARGGL